MPITRMFIDWSRPLIPAVVDHLFERYSVLRVADLRQVVVAFPSRHGLKRFDDLWARRTGGVGHPPRRITVGDLPELLYQPLRPFASELVQKLAWGEAVRTLPRHKMERVLGHLPDDADFDAWLSVGEMLWRTHIELAADGLNFGDVARLGADLPGFREGPRWEAMREMQTTYLSTLDNLEMWDQQTARLVAIERRECHTTQDIILVGAADLNIALRQMLDQVADRVTAYVHGPVELAERFDAHGCLIPHAWEHVDVELSEEQVAVVDGPPDQARAVVERLRSLNGTRRIDEITIGVPDERMVPVLRRVLGEADVACYRSIESTLRETSPYKLLMAVALWLEGERPSEFAELARHPAITGWLADQGVPSRWLMELDKFLARHLQSRLGKWPAATDDEHYNALKRAYDLVTALLAGMSVEARLLGEWADAVTEFLLTVYRHREFDLDDPDSRLAVESCRRIWQALSANQEVPELLMPAVTAYQAIRMTLGSCGSQSIPPEAQVEGVELLGWLDLAQDDNRVLVLTNFNEGFIPSAVNADLFLPNALRQHLGLTDNARRYARDVHALQALLASRDSVSLIVGRRNARNEPLVPSRLLFATDGSTIAARIRRFYGRKAGEVSSTGSSPADPRPVELLTERVSMVPKRERRLDIPRPDVVVPPVGKLSVTAFRSYLACPYRFYLRHVLKLKTVEEDAVEMAPNVFGDFVHTVLSEFGRSPAAQSVDERTIRESVLGFLDTTAVRWFGADPLPVVQIQLEQICRRLRAFAVWQTAQARDGWRIHAVERDLKMEFGRANKLVVSGRIDRIDRHEATNRFRILDYKTSDKAKTPEKVHRSNDRWVDLQLPLYRHLAWNNGIQGELQLGYVSLSGEADESLLSMANWQDAELAEADQTAFDVVERILRGDFAPMSEREVRDAPEFARICQEGVFGREVLK